MRTFFFFSIPFSFLWMLIILDVCGQESYRDAVTQGLRYQIQADSMQRLVEAQILALSTAPESKKRSIRITIRDHEALSVALQKKANEWFDWAATCEETSSVSTVAGNAESIAEKQNPVTMIVFEILEDHNNKESEFAILFKSPYSATNPVPIGEPLPDGVAYKIQLGAFSKPLSANTFKGLTPLSGEKLENGITKYYAGLFRRFTDASDALRKVHEYGFKDAYIVAFYNRKTIQPERARQLEK